PNAVSTMFKLLQHAIITFLILLCCTVALHSKEGNTFCKYYDDPIIVGDQDARYHLDLSGSHNLITLCNLEVGKTYRVSGVSHSDQSCEFQFGFDSGSKFLINPS